jgi:GNAT superfamily N-acetyltransferase
VKIRAATAGDLQALAAIVAATPLWQRYGVTVASAQAALASGLAAGDSIALAEGETGPAGLFWVQPRAGFGRSPYLKWLGVAPGQTGGGVGQTLLRAAEEAARGVRPELLLLCSDFNLAGQRFYAREGYARIGALPDYVLPGVAEHLFFKKL